MADPKDKSGSAGGPKPPAPGLPATPAIPRLTPAIPEPVRPAQPSAPRAPVPSAPRPASANTPPPVAPVPRVAPLVPSVPPAAAPPRPPAAEKPPSVPAARTGSFPSVPAIAPLAKPSPPAAPPRAPPVLTAAPARAKPAAAPPVQAPAPAATPVTSGGLEELAELERRFAVLDQLDYFEVMGLEPTAAPADIKRAFHHQSRTYHPDRYFQSADMALRERVHAVYKRVTEAYFVLRDDVRRKKYQADITGPDRLLKLRFDEAAEAEAKAAVKKEVAEQIGTHPKGRQFFQVGLADLEAGRLTAAERNIKLALTYEPTNPLYLEKLEETRAKAYEEYKRSGRGFRIE